MPSSDEHVRAFEQLLAAVKAAPAADQQRLVDSFVAQHPQSPLLATDEAVIWYCGAGNTLILRGDMLQERSEPLVRLGETTLHYHCGRYEPNARLDYHLLVDGRDIGDPRNPRQVPSSYGPRAELRMPGYVAAERWRPRSDVPAGTVARHEDVQSSYYPSSRTVWVYLPASYTSAERYPSVYFHDGGDYLAFAHAASLLDHLIALEELPACIGVFVNPSHEHGRVVDYDFNPGYCRLISEELVPWIDARYATHREARDRAIVGASFGGLVALDIAQHCPDVFGSVAGQSSFVSRRADAIIDRFRESQRLRLRIHLIVGTYEPHIGPFGRDSGEANFLSGNRRMRDVLSAQGYQLAYAEYPEGHSWGLWREQLGSALQFLLRDSHSLSRDLP